MDKCEEIYNKFIETGDVEPENVLLLMQYLQKVKSCEFTMKYTPKLPMINVGGYTVGIKSVENNIEILVSTAASVSSMPSTMLALAKLRTQLLG
jgi:hypothetical protein